jgi:hypothetical protein
MNMPGLLDSGADNSMFPLAWATHLGIDPASCREEECSTAAGMTKQYIWPDGLDAEILALGKTVHLSACFSEGLPVVLLGREDFFAEFRVGFDQRSQTFTLQSY